MSPTNHPAPRQHRIRLHGASTKHCPRRWTHPGARNHAPCTAARTIFYIFGVSEKLATRSRAESYPIVCGLYYLYGTRPPPPDDPVVNKLAHTLRPDAPVTST